MSKKLGALVKEARTESGLTQAALAKKVKSLTASDISKIERGEKEPDTETLKEMAKVLGVTQASLLNAASGKTAAAKTSGTAKKTAAKTSGTAKKTASSKTGTTADLKLTAAEKKLVQLYRKADADTKKTAVGILDGSVSVKNLLMTFVRAKSGSASKPSSGIQDLLGSLLGGDTGQSPDTDSGASSLGSLLEGLLGKR